MKERELGDGAAPVFGESLKKWEDFIGNKVAVLEIEGGCGATGVAALRAIEYAPNFDRRPPR
jgi:hypothetical protein